MWVQQRHTPPDNAQLIQPLNTAPAWGDGKPDMFSYFSHSQTGILLQNIKNFSINSIHQEASICG
jgi:hypothetical protein